ncbi:MAG: carboxypeptidase-like regulatory domain-containing protein [Gemmataceae bacterium]|nr:carboxypeptidase-like regulatory domain-containing protein [Gemmataceae bacterium]
MSARFRSVRPRLVVLAALGAALAVTAGCAKSGKVSGKVTLPDGSPLPGGLILFAPEDSTHNPSSAIIKEDGTYEVSDVPTGTCKVSIDNRMAGVTEIPVGAGGGYNAVKTDKSDSDKGGKKGGMKGPPGKKGGDPNAPPAASKGGEDAISAARAAAGGPASGARVPVPGQKVDINKKYYTPESSGLTISVSGGSNTYDVKLAQ